MKKLLLPILFAGSALLAFDTRTHVWIAQEVINDLEDGKITIAPFGDFDVDPEITGAILQNQKVYRMGNIGPDGFPDVIGGQVTVHPGLEDGTIDDETQTVVSGWKSDTWFKWVLSKAQTPQEKAFAYGFLGHGASDTFAHTYVNMYSGDIFDMNDGETDVEKRHIFLEKFISDRLPTFKDNSDNVLGEAHELVAIDDELPISFIKSTLLMNESVAQQYALSGSANYLAKMYEFRQKIAGLDDDNTEAVIDGDLAEASDQCDSSWYPGKYILSIFGSQDEACEEKSFLEKKRDAIDALKLEYSIQTYSFKASWLAQIDHAIDEYIKTSSRMSQGFMDVNGDTYGELTDWINCYSSAFTDPTTVGSQAIEGSCQLTSQIQDELSFLDDITAQLDFTAISELKSEVDGISNSLGLEIVDLLGVAAIEIITVKDQDVSEDSLNEQFGIDESEKHLLLINDIAQRVKIEMGLNIKGELDPQLYHVLYNAVVLSKLSLLSAEQINLLVARADVSSPYQFTDQDSTFSILFNSIKTIDGNHQWLHQAPPYPRVESFEDTVDHFYGYESDSIHGFKLYETTEMRQKLFNKIFKGPLSLGLETPSVIYKDAILPATYPYVSCAENPFPNGVLDQSCNSLVPPIDDGNLTTALPIDEDAEELSWWERFINSLREVIMSYYYEIVGEENIISTTQTDETVEITTTVPDDGIEF